MMRHQAILGIFLPLLLCLALSRQAQAFAEFSAFYYSDSMAAATSTSASRMFIEGTIGFSVDRKGNYLIGWTYGLFSSTDSAGTTTTYASTQMGPRFVWQIDKQHHWSLGLGYYLVTSASFNAGTDEKWKGTAIKADVGYNFDVSDKLQLGVRLNYDSASYTEKLVGDTTYSVVGYTRSFMYPSFYSIYMF